MGHEYGSGWGLDASGDSEEGVFPVRNVGEKWRLHRTTSMG